MKFKITSSQYELIKNFFDGKDKNFVGEIILEPVDQTATQAMYEQSIKNTAWHEGYHYGLKEGYHKARKPELCVHQILCGEMCKPY